MVLTERIAASKNEIDNISEILLVTCLASGSEMTRQGKATSPVCCLPFILAQNVSKKFTRLSLLKKFYSALTTITGNVDNLHVTFSHLQFPNSIPQLLKHKFAWLN